MRSVSTHLSAEEARQRAEEALAAQWPGWKGALEPLKPLGKPLRATPFRVTGGPEPAVIKLWGPGNSAKAAAQAARQAELAGMMAKGTWRVPQVLAYDPKRCALLMQDARAPDLRTLARRAPLPGLMAQAGGWLGAFHALSLRPHPFRPAGQLTWLQRLEGEARAGQRSLRDPGEFSCHLADLAAEARELRGAPWVRAVTHRDLTLSNLLQDADGTVWGIDFENTREDEPLRDRFTLALDVLSLCEDKGARASALTGLREGYGVGRDAPEIRRHVQRGFALGVWAATPARPSRRQAARLEAALVLLDAEAALI